jgi:outer membrane protein assembly factor BamA
MKKLILALLAMGTLATANAQEPHSILLYGDATLATNRDATLNKHTDWDAHIGMGYQFNHNWTLGLSVMWGQNAIKDPTGSSNTDNLYMVGPFARYSHYIRKSETFFWYSQLDFDYAGGYHTNDGNPATAKHTGVYVGLFPALGINVGRGLCLNFNIGGINYATDKLTTATNSDNSFNFNFGRQANIGISKNFNCGHKMHSHHEPGDEVHRRKADKMEDEDDAAPKPKRKERNRDDDE